MCRHADTSLNPVLHLHLNGGNSALGLLCNDHFQVGDLDRLAKRAFLLFLPFLVRFVDAEAGTFAHLGLALEDVTSSFVPVNRSVDSLDIHQTREARESVFTVNRAVMAPKILLIEATLLEANLVCSYERTDSFSPCAKKLFLLHLKLSFSNHRLQ